MSLPAGDNTTVAEIREKVQQAIYQQAVDSGEQVESIDDINMPIIAVVKDRKIELMARSNFMVANLERGYKFVALERNYTQN